jgi:uncharacterized protein (TIGR02246 family)
VSARAARTKSALVVIGIVACLTPGAFSIAFAGDVPAGPAATSATAAVTTKISAVSHAVRDVEAALQRYAHFTVTLEYDSTAAMFTADGQMLQPQMAPLVGRQAIHDFLAPLAAKYAVGTATMVAEDTRVFGATAYQWGTYDQTSGLKGGTLARYAGRFVAEWSREADGVWRLKRMMAQPTVVRG